MGLIFKWGLFSSGAYFPNQEFQIEVESRNSNNFSINQRHKTKEFAEKVENLGFQCLHVFCTFILHSKNTEKLFKDPNFERGD